MKSLKHFKLCISASKDKNVWKSKNFWTEKSSKAWKAWTWKAWKLEKLEKHEIMKNWQIAQQQDFKDVEAWARAYLGIAYRCRSIASFWQLFLNNFIWQIKVIGHLETCASKILLFICCCCRLMMKVIFHDEILIFGWNFSSRFFVVGRFARERDFVALFLVKYKFWRFVKRCYTVGTIVTLIFWNQTKKS